MFHEEPAPTDHPLFELDNVIVLPHVAGSTRKLMPAKDLGTAESVRAIFDGTLSAPTVNRDELRLWAANDGFDSGDTPDPDPF